MSNWKNLVKDINKWLKDSKPNGFEYRNDRQAIIGFEKIDRFDGLDKKYGFRSDGMLTKDSVLIAVEIEAGQPHPDTNAGKYWPFLSSPNLYKKIILFHIYTPDFNSYWSRLKLAEFYVEKMKHEFPKKFECIFLDCREDDDYNLVLNKIKDIVKKKFKQEFKIDLPKA